MKTKRIVGYNYSILNNKNTNIFKYSRSAELNNYNTKHNKELKHIKVLYLICCEL